MKTQLRTALAPLCILALITIGVAGCGNTNAGTSTGAAVSGNQQASIQAQDSTEDLEASTKEGQQTFRFDTFGDERFWGDTLKLHLAIEGRNLGGVGNGVSPKTALDIGLKVDADALPSSLVSQLQQGTVDLNDPATTLALLKLNAVVGVTGVFNDNGTLKSIGIHCALCHSTVDNSLTAGIGRRLDGWANRDLNVGAIIALAPDLSAIVSDLRVVDGSIDAATVRKVLNSWGPGKFDAQLLLDGKAFRPDGKPAATLIPNAFGMQGFNMHTWTADWGSVPYWNAFVAIVEMGGVGNFFDPRLDDPQQFPDIASRFPIAVAKKKGHIMVDPDSDRVTGKLAGLHLYQLSLFSPEPQPGTHFNSDAAKRGDDLFSGKAKCATCHVEPLWTEPGWNAHRPEDIGIDNFQSERSPGRAYKTMNLAGLFIRELGINMKPENKGRFYHDGRFATLLDVVNHYNSVLGLGLSDQEKSDLVEYLKALKTNGSSIEEETSNNQTSSSQTSTSQS